MSERDLTWWLARGEGDIDLLPALANRHGLIAGATGTGKTVSLRVLAEAFSDGGVPVFLADIKGDLTGLVAAGAIVQVQRGAGRHRPAKPGERHTRCLRAAAPAPRSGGRTSSKPLINE